MRRAGQFCRIFLIAACLGTAPQVSATQAADGAPGGDDPLATGLARLAEGRHAEAVEILAALVAEEEGIADRDPSQAERAIRAVIGAGQALRHLGRHEEALEFFEAAILRNTATTPLDALRLAAADCAFRSQAWERAREHCDAVIGSTDQIRLRFAAERLWIRAQTQAGHLDEAWQRLEQVSEPEEGSGPEGAGRGEWAELALDVGLQALAKHEPELAGVAFRWYLEHAAAAAPRETAVLGIAWAAAQGAETYDVAAERLLEFVEQFPQSPHVPRALAVAAGCLKRSDQEALAGDVLQRLLKSGGEVDSETVVSALLHSAGGIDPDLWRSATEALLKNSESRGRVGHVLTVLTDRQQPADAERLAAVILGDSSDQAIEPAFEQACRWAALQGRWSMLALSAESAETSAAVARLSPLSLRLLAEGLVQVGRGPRARPLLDRLIEEHGVTDFDVFVRRAEIALVHDSREIAGGAVAQAVAAATTPAEQTLSEMLQSQLLIREARMDEARVLLEGIVRRAEAVEEIKARAQWLIGETHFLQRRFDEAIEAYRLVETFDAAGHWTAAALVQAGKAFEQLGRPRDAAICYSGLLRRFSDSPHAAAAGDRLAAIGRKTELR